MSARSKAIAARAAARAADPDADPDFLALSAKQQRNIDRVFQRAIQRSSGRYSNKRRKTETPVKNEKGKGKAKAQDDEAGGFVEDAEMGGFLPDEEGGFLPDSGDEGGGFVPDDDAGDGGGFMVDDDDNGDGGFVPDEPTVSPRPRTATSATDQIPLGMISTLLASLGLPSDNDVLAVFKASATGWHADTEDAGESRVRKRDAEVNEDDLGVAKKDFRAVCAALMGPDNGAGDDDDAVSSEDLGAGDDEDDFTMDSQSDSSLSSLSASSFEGGKRGAKGSTRTPRKKSVGKGKSGDEGGSRKRKSKKKLLEEEGPIKLTLRQKDMVSDLWSLVKPKADKQGRAGRVLGKDEVKNLVRTLGEMWTDEEIADMVTLFSSQHEGRGLTYEDFGVVMLKAGLV